MVSKPVLIIGSGLSGLALAHALKEAGIPFRVYERDSASEQRPQGYRLRINAFGLDALAKCVPQGIYERFEETTAEDLPPVFVRRDPRTWESIDKFELPDFSQDKVRKEKMQRLGIGSRSLPADRRVMRSVLLSGLDDFVSYGKSFVDYETSETGVIAHFADGTSSEEGSLLVGADGLYSRVARKLAGDALLPKPTGSWMIFGKALLTPQLEGKISSDLVGGMARLVEIDDAGNQTSLFLEAMRFKHAGAPADYLYWVLIGDSERFGVSAEQLPKLSNGEIVNVSKRVVENWHPAAKGIIDEQQTGETAVLGMHTSSIDGVPDWTPSERVTIIGDAVHCMPPVGGSGANTAFRDVANLIEKLKAEVDDDGFGQAVQKYEAEMREYAGEVVHLSYEAAVNFFGIKPVASS